jgi:hypothetical protein
VTGLGIGVPNCSVVIGNGSAVVTDANGNFTINNVSPPYNLFAILRGTTSTGVVEYVGLTRLDPTIQLEQGATSLQPATVNGTVTGGAGYPLPAGYQTQVQFAPSTYPGYSFGPSGGGILADSATGKYSETYFLWFNPSSTVTVSALQMQLNPNTHLPAAFTGFGIVGGLTLTSGGTWNNVNIPLSPVSSSSVSGSVSVPTGFQLSNIGMMLMVGQGGLLLMVDQAPGSSTSFSYIAPNVPGAFLTLSSTARKPGYFSQVVLRNVPVTATNLAFDFSDVPDYVQPPEGAAGIRDSSTFSWSAASRAVYVIKFQSVASPSLYGTIYTTATQGTLPLVPSEGISLSPGASYTWFVTSVGPFNSVDEAAGAAGPQGWITANPSTELRTTMNGYLTPHRKFTAAP